ncbi:MAG: hypothetical protein Q4E02_03465 [Lagierella massiliensis]|nr:hypothetical protein [Lagierella massiliensis]
MKNNKYLCDSLKGRVSYAPEDMVFLTVDGEAIYFQELLQECRKIFGNYSMMDLQRDLDEIEELNVKTALYSPSPTKVIMALLDKRLEIRDLKNFRSKYENSKGIISFLYNLRFQAEGFYL